MNRWASRFSQRVMVLRSSRAVTLLDWLSLPQRAIGATRRSKTRRTRDTPFTSCRTRLRVLRLRLPASITTEYLFRDGLQLQVRRAFVDLADLRVAIELLDRVVLHVAVAAEQLDRQ